MNADCEKNTDLLYPYGKHSRFELYNIKLIDLKRLEIPAAHIYNTDDYSTLYEPAPGEIATGERNLLLLSGPPRPAMLYFSTIICFGEDPDEWYHRVDQYSCVKDEPVKFLFTDDVSGSSAEVSYQLITRGVTAELEFQYFSPDEEEERTVEFFQGEIVAKTDNHCLTRRVLRSFGSGGGNGLKNKNLPDRFSVEHKEIIGLGRSKLGMPLNSELVLEVDLKYRYRSRGKQMKIEDKEDKWMNGAISGAETIRVPDFPTKSTADFNGDDGSKISLTVNWTDDLFNAMYRAHKFAYRWERTKF